MGRVRLPSPFPAGGRGKRAWLVVRAESGGGLVRIGSTRARRIRHAADPPAVVAPQRPRFRGRRDARGPIFDVGGGLAPLALRLAPPGDGLGDPPPEGR